MWMFWMMGAVILAVLVVALCLGRAAAMADQYPHDTGLTVRGWDKRVHEDEDPWWMREYPAHDDA